MTRFDEGLFTGTAASANRPVQSASNQPYPGDDIDPTATGSVRNHVLRPDMPVGQSGQVGSSRATQPLSSPSQPGSIRSAPSSSAIRSEPLPPPGASSGGSLPAPQAGNDRAFDGRASSGGRSATTLTVQPGETVYNLSRRFNVPVSAILAANNLSNGAQLQVGQKVDIPARADGARRASAVADVRAAEPERKAPPQPGSNQVAVLPQTSKTRESSREESDSASTGARSGAGGIHTVSSGDTLYGLSKQTGVSVERLKAANDLSDGSLHIGQKLTIPGAQDESPRQVASAEPESKSAKVDAGTADDTGARSGNDRGDGNGKEPREVAAYTPPKDDAVGKQSSGDKTASLPDSTGVGRLRWPVDGRVISAFGSGEGSSGDGMDIAVPDGTPVKAAENGVVIYAGNGLKEFGNTVLVRHEDGLVTVYGHASKIEVKRGDTVKRGQTLALSGMSGNASRPKLHFEVRKESAPVDPSQYLR